MKQEQSKNNSQKLKHIIQNNLKELKQWLHNPIIKDKYQNTVALYLASNGIIPPKEWQHDTAISDENQNTVAMLLAMKGIYPPSQWLHNTYLKNNQGKTVQQILQEKKLHVPKIWDSYYSYQQQIIQQYCNELHLKVKQYNPSFQDNAQKLTLAMWMAQYGQLPLKEFQHNILLRDTEGLTVAMMLCQNYIIPPNNWIHDLKLSDNNEKTLKDYFKENYLPIPSHDDIFSEAIFRQIPKTQGYKSKEQNKHGFTIAMILAINNITIPKCWYHVPSIQNDYGMTVAMYMARNGIIPENQWNHEPNLVNCDNYTVAMFLIENDIEVPKQWYHKQELRNKNGYTPALLLAQKGIIPSQEWEHDKYLKVQYFDPNANQIRYYSVQKFLLEYQLQVPKQWSYKLLDQYENSKALQVAKNGKIPNQQSNPSYQNILGETVAMVLVMNKHTPTKEWYHGPYIKNYLNKRVFDLCVEYEIIPPEHFCIKPSSTKFGHCQTFAMILAKQNKVIPKYLVHDPNIKNDYNETVFDIFVKNNQVPQKEFCFPTTQQDKDGNTQAMILAKHKIKIPDYLNHDPKIKNNEGQTVEMIMIQNNQQPDNVWICKPEIQQKQKITYNQCPDISIQNKNKKNNTKVKENKQENKQESEHDIWLKNLYVQLLFSDAIGETVAMILARHRILIPKQFYHDPLLRNKFGYTVALMQAESGIIPDKQWQHNKFLRAKCQYNGKTYFYSVQNFLQLHNIPVPNEWKYETKNINENNQEINKAKTGIIPKYNGNNLYQNLLGETVAITLAKHGIIPTKPWLHDVYLQDAFGNSIKSILQSKEFKYHNCQFIPDFCAQLPRPCICQLCKQDHFQITILSCKHIICSDCIYKIARSKGWNCYPICGGQPKHFSQQFVLETLRHQPFNERHLKIMQQLKIEQQQHQ